MNLDELRASARRELDKLLPSMRATLAGMRAPAVGVEPSETAGRLITSGGGYVMTSRNYHIALNPPTRLRTDDGDRIVTSRGDHIRLAGGYEEMAQTTTHINACDASVWLDNASGTLTDISGSANSVGISFTREVGELRTFQSKWPVRTGCGKDVEISLRVVYSTAADEGKDILLDWFFESAPAARTFDCYVPTKNVGSDYFSGEVVLGDVNFDADPTEPSPIAVEATLHATGEFTRSTAAT